MPHLIASYILVVYQRVSRIIDAADRDSYPKWQPSLQPIGTQQGSLGASTFGVGRLP